MNLKKTYDSYLKSPYRSIKYDSYFYVYDHLFKKYIDKKLIFVEVGVLDGGSLFMWRDYFGEKARIIGVDLNPEAKKWEKHGFEIFIGSQSDPLFWDRFGEEIGNIDILLDDGGHTYEQQIITVEKIINKINDGGLLIVEDTHTSYLSMFGPKKYSFINYTKMLIDKINFRSERINQISFENRIWSINIFESMVVFHVDRQLSSRKSIFTENKPKSNKAKDFRYHDQKSLHLLRKLKTKFNYFKNFKMIKYIENKILAFIAWKSFKGKKYFK